MTKYIYFKQIYNCFNVKKLTSEIFDIEIVKQL